MDNLYRTSLDAELRRLSRLVSGIAAAMALLAAIAIPVAFFALGLSYEYVSARREAKAAATRVSRYIYGKESIWRFELLRLEGVLERSLLTDADPQLQILDTSGQVIITVGRPPAAPTITADAAVVEAVRQAGTLRVTQSIRPMVVYTAWATLLSLLLGVAIFLSVRLLPMRTLRAAFRRLEESQAQLFVARNALEQSGSSVHIANPEGYITYVNKAFERLTGYSAAEALHRHCRTLVADADDGRTFDETWDAVNRDTVWNGRLAVLRKDGTQVQTNATYSVIRDPSARVSNYLVVQNDITDQLRLEARLSQRQRLEALGTLAGGIAHDINNILVPIIGCAELLGADMDPASEAYESLQLIRRSAGRAADLVAQILLFSRVGRGRPATIDLVEIMHEVVGLLAAEAPHTVSIVERAPAAEVLATIDPSHMHQVMMNLCVNAQQAVADGGTIVVSLDTVHLSNLKTYSGNSLSGPFVRFAVQDDGIGMEEHVLAHIFEPFFTTRSNMGSTGMGLATLYGILHQYDGDVVVHTTPDKGSIFAVYLPAPARPDTDLEAAAATSALKDIGRGHGTRILIVDDEPDVGLVGKRMLERHGYDVTVVTDGLDALTLVQSDVNRFGLVITDKRMPRLSGEELCQELHRLRPDLPVILWSGFNDTIDGPQALALGVAEVLQKPVAQDVLVGAVQRVLERK